MTRTLLGRLILSHILPSIIIIPLMGLTIIYVMETQVIVPTLVRELRGNALLLAELVADNEELWHDPISTNALLTRINADIESRVMFLDPSGRLFASSDPADAAHIGEFISARGLAEAQSGQIAQYTNHSTRLDAEIVDVFIPVVDVRGNIAWIIRMSHKYSTLYEDFLKVRYLIAIILFFGMVTGGLLAVILSFNIRNPLRIVTQAVNDIAYGEHKHRIVEQGPEEIQTLAKAVNFLNDRLNNLEIARKQLLANLVHEIGRPLGALRSAIQALAKGAGQDPQLLEELTEGMDEETVLLQHLMDDLAHLYDQELGALELNRQPISLETWIPKILRPWQEAARKKRIHWQLQIASNLPDLYADSMRLAQVIENLVGNAIKYTPRNGEVTIEVGQEKEDIWIRVSDTGPGISPEEQERVFTPFYRGDQGRRIKQGMGLGLSIARDLINAHGGVIELDSNPGLGSQFTIHLPIRT